jgi:hypothetical protein
MNNKQKKDKLMLENLDHIVAGEKLNEKSELDKETKATLELTREMTSWPKSPSKEFKAELKAKLTHQVAEQKKRDALKSGGSEFQEILNRPAWQLTIAAIIALIIVAIIIVIIYIVQH